MKVDVRRSVLPYRPCRTCHSTATTMLFCILLLMTTPVFSDFCAIRSTFSDARGVLSFLPVGPYPARDLRCTWVLGLEPGRSAPHSRAAAFLAVLPLLPIRPS